MGTRGYVYVLSNPSMPGVVKIGRSANGGFSRSRAIYTGSTGVPQPFHLEFELLTDDAHALEQAVHDCLGRYRINDSREFFRCSTEQAIKCVINEYLSYRVEEEIYLIDSNQFSAVEGAMLLASNIEEDYAIVCDSIYYITDEAIRQAVKVHKDGMARIAEERRLRLENESEERQQ